MSAAPLINTEQAAALLGYANGKTFTKAVKKHRIPCRRINARKIMFDEAELMEWTKGGRK